MNQNNPITQFSQLVHGIIFLTMVLLLFFPPDATAQIETTDPPPPPPPFQLDPKIQVSPSMAIILICLFGAFFVMGCVSVYVRQCTDRRMSLAAGGDFSVNGGDPMRRRTAALGLDPAVVDAFPVFLYSDVKGLKIGSVALECAVCLNEFESDETLRLLPKCSHVYHPDCIDAWLACHVTCPVCRANLVPRPGELRHCSITCQDTDIESPDRTHFSRIYDPARDVNDITIDVESPVVINPTLTPNQNRPPRLTPRKERKGKYSRSYSASYSEVKSVSNNYERFTLRLPEEVRSQLMNSSLIRTRSCVAFTSARSSRKGYRSSSIGGSNQGKNFEYYERFDRAAAGQSDGWGLTITPPFFSRVNSARSPKVGVWDGLTATPKSLCNSVKSQFDCLAGGVNIDDVEERRFERLRPKD
ncbi:hypothetical protein LguiA_004117 [Lonicera macranthoides]